MLNGSGPLELSYLSTAQQVGLARLRLHRALTMRAKHGRDLPIAQRELLRHAIKLAADDLRALGAEIGPNPFVGPQARAL